MTLLRRSIHIPQATEEPAPITRPADYRVWVFWWQGEAQMPDIIRATCRSIRANAGCEVVLVSKDNCRQYVDLPDCMERKVGRGGFLLAHLSDYVRIALLERYGGLWLDSTILLAKPLPREVLKMRFFSIKAAEFDGRLDGKYVAAGRWNCQVLGTNVRHHPLLARLKDCLKQYWQQFDGVADYLFFDYLIALLYEECPDVRREIDALPVTNRRMHDLLPLLGRPAAEVDMASLTADTWLFKLTYKLGRICDTSKEGTVYQEIIRQWRE